MKLNDCELDLCSGSHLTNWISPCHFSAVVCNSGSGPSDLCMEEEIRVPEQQLGVCGKSLSRGA